MNKKLLVGGSITVAVLIALTSVNSVTSAAIIKHNILYDEELSGENHNSLLSIKENFNRLILKFFPKIVYEDIEFLHPKILPHWFPGFLIIFFIWFICALIFNYFFGHPWPF